MRHSHPRFQFSENLAISALFFNSQDAKFNFRIFATKTPHFSRKTPLPKPYFWKPTLHIPTKKKKKKKVECLTWVHIWPTNDSSLALGQNTFTVQTNGLIWPSDGHWSLNFVALHRPHPIHVCLRTRAHTNAYPSCSWSKKKKKKNGARLPSSQVLGEFVEEGNVC